MEGAAAKLQNTARRMLGQEPVFVKINNQPYLIRMTEGAW